MKDSFLEKLCSKVTYSNIPDDEQIPFVSEVIRRYKTGSYKLPESIVNKYRQYLNESPYKNNGCKYYYLRELVYLPVQAINDYYSLIKKRIVRTHIIYGDSRYYVENFMVR